MDGRILVYEDRDGFGRFAEKPECIDPRYSVHSVAYIRADLVDQLIGYAEHDIDCERSKPGKVVDHVLVDLNPCTCGLSEKIREVRGQQ